MFTLRVANRGILTCRHLNKVLSQTDKCFGTKTVPVVCISHYKGFHQSRSLWDGDNQDKSTEQPEQKVRKQKRKKKKASQPTENKKEADTTDKQPKLTVATKNKKVPGKKSKSKIETIVKEVASELHPGEDAEVERATSELELLNRMLQIEQSSTNDNDDSGGAQNVSSYLDNLKEEKQIEEKMHVKQVAKTLHSTETLNIFKNGSSTVKTAEDLNPDSSKWSAIDWHDKYFFDEVEKFKDMAPPSTQFDEVYRLMDQGKMWKFPINNEEGMEEEQNVPFHQHVFLDDKLNEGDWCPRSGPIRLFMVSVITALSANPHLTVKEKHLHIEWFRDYFNEKKAILETLGLFNTKKQKQL